METNVSLLRESQVTQILKEALHRGATPKQVPQQEPEVCAEKNSASPDIKSPPDYHYHGLAVTQSQGQPDYLGVEGSQSSQETSRSSANGPDHKPTVSLDNLSPPLTPKSPPDRDGLPGTPSITKTGKAISFVSPHPPPVTPLRKSKSLHVPAAHRSPSPQSQDSFAGSIPVNPEAAFLAKSKRFGLPLSQLENSQEDSMFSPIPSKQNPGPSFILDTSQSSSDQSDSQNPASRTQGGSQLEVTGYPQGTNDTNYLNYVNDNRNPYIDRSGVNFSQSPDSSSGSSGNLYESRPYEGPTQVVESTQPESDLVPTQPSTQVARESAEAPTQTDDDPPADAPLESVPPSANSYQLSTAASSNSRSLFNQLKKWRQVPGIPHPPQPPSGQRQSELVVPETPLQTEYTETRSTGEGWGGTTLSTPEPPPASPLPQDSRSPVRSPLPSTQFMAPPPNPLQTDEDETMDVVPDSEPSRLVDGPMSSSHPPDPVYRVPPPVEKEDEIVPESSRETDDKASMQKDADHIAQDETRQEAKPEADRDGDSTVGDRLLVNGRRNRSPNLVPEEQAEQEVRSDATAPETEDEVPLATVVKSVKPPQKPLPSRGRSTRNKRPIVYTESPDISENEEQEEPEKNPIERPAKRRKVEKAKNAQEDSTPVATRGRGGKKAKQQSSAKAVKEAIKGSAAKPKPQKGRGKGKKGSTNTNNVESSEQNSPPVHDDEAKTEPTEDDEDRGFDSSDDMPPVRKRKRPAHDLKPHRTTSGTSSFQGITPQRGGSKRIRSHPGSLRDIAQSDCTRVFARWPLCSHFYTGYVHSRSPVQSDLYVVRFDDETECPVHISDLRRSELKVGDEVFVMGYKQPAWVVAIDRWDVEGYIRVRVDTGGELDVRANLIKVHESVIAEKWGKRLVHEHSICTSLQAQGLNTSARKSNPVNGTSTSKFLKQIGFVVTMKSNEDRTHIFDLITKNGGKVIEDWEDLFPFLPSQTDRSWVARQADVKHKELGVQTVFLLADEPNQKPKYLVALALGIPCVSTRWLFECHDQHALVNWRHHLLPAGEYTYGLMSQRVNLRWGDKSRPLHEIYRDMYGSNSILREKSILCIGMELFPPGGKFRNLKRINSEENKQYESTRKLPSIMLAMGADQVEAVCEVEHAQCETTEYDLILVKGKEEVQNFNASNEGERPPCVHIPWVKECLVAGKLLDFPEV